jgi:hypothetical protein
MSKQTRPSDEGGGVADVLIRDGDQTYAVPAAVLDRYRIAPERRAEVESHLDAPGSETPAPEMVLYELPSEALAPYRLSDEARAALEAPVATGEECGDAHGFVRYAPNQPRGEPISGYTGYAYSVTFGSFQRDQYGRRVYVGVFPMYQAPASSGPYPGLR